MVDHFIMAWWIILSFDETFSHFHGHGGLFYGALAFSPIILYVRGENHLYLYIVLIHPWYLYMVLAHGILLLY